MKVQHKLDCEARDLMGELEDTYKAIAGDTADLNSRSFRIFAVGFMCGFKSGMSASFDKMEQEVKALQYGHGSNGMQKYADGVKSS